MRSGLFFHLNLIFLVAAISGCGVPKTSTGGGGTSIITSPGPPEETYCSTTSTFTPPTITISGSATYQARQLHMSSGQPVGLGSAASASTNPIRYAEVMVKDSSGQVVQCAETDISGDYTFELPQDGKSYTVYVNSRALNEHLKASILNAPDSNRHYSLAGDFTADVTKTLPTMNAPVTGTVLGGAFNILDQLVKANTYLKTQTGSCNYAGCVKATSSNIPKIQVYWKKGFDPKTYINSIYPVSFYLPGYSRLFLVGGNNGDVDHSDTDHFDNSVIIHEYGHFLEDIFFKGDSPGGEHNGDKIIDPRLAWSEGFANFFQAAVLYPQSASDPYYADTVGNVDGATSILRRHLEADDKDKPEALGEGIFREFSITRLLWDALDTNVDSANGATDNVVSDAFTDIWAALTKNTDGFNNSNLAFRNVGNFHVFQRALSGEGGADFSTIRTIEHHVDDNSEYAQQVSTGTTCTYSLTPASVSGDDGSFGESDLFRNNDFYHLKLSSAQTVTLRLDYWDTDGSGMEADVDLYVYNENARYGVAVDMVGYSEKTPDGNPGTAEYESIRKTFAAGNYLINVKVYTGGFPGTEFNYTLKLEGSHLCP